MGSALIFQYFKNTFSSISYIPYSVIVLILFWSLSVTTIKLVIVIVGPKGHVEGHVAANIHHLPFPTQPSWP